MSWFVVSRADAADVSRFILTDPTLLNSSYHLTFDVVRGKRELEFVSIFSDLHGMNSVGATGLPGGRTSTKLLDAMKSKRQSPQQWISYGRACLLREDMNIEEFKRRGREGVARSYMAAMDAFERGWREMLVAINRIEGGDLVCEAGEKRELVDLQMRIVQTTARHCAHAPNRNRRRVGVVRAFVYHFLKEAPEGTNVDDLLQVFLNLAHGGLDLKDYPLALYALAKALSLQPGHQETNTLLARLDHMLGKSWCDKAWGVQSLLKDLLRKDPDQHSSWLLVQPTVNNFAADTMDALKRDVFESVNFW
ncbi:MAG: hypothetical protein Q9178_002809 [Gyalolechia marmorata]